jgi:hypothetical protein
MELLSALPSLCHLQLTCVYQDEGRRCGPGVLFVAGWGFALGPGSVDSDETHGTTSCMPPVNHQRPQGDY